MEQKLLLTGKKILIENSDELRELGHGLNKLIAKMINSREEFLTFAGKAESEALYRLCQDTKERREDAVVTLQRFVSRIGSDPATDENFIGWLHHSWTKARLAVEQSPDHVIVSETAREEESMRLAFEETLELPQLPAEIAEFVRSEATWSRDMNELMVQLKDQLKPDDYVDLNRS